MTENFSSMISDLQIANLKLREGAFLEAIKIYERLLKEKPELQEVVQFNLEWAQKRQNGYDDFLSKKEKNIRFDKQNIEINQHSLDADLFNPTYYLKENPDVRESGMDPESHYWSHGESEGRWPNACFDPTFYLRINADVRQAKISAFRHYIEAGYREERIGCSPMIQTTRTHSNTSKPLLFVGHDGVQAGSEVVLLEVIRWFYEHTTRRIKLLLLAPGPLSNRYVHCSDLYVLPEGRVDQPESFTDFLNEDFEFIYLNTVVSGRFLSLIDENNIRLKSPFLAHIHEMEKVLNQFPEELEYLKKRVEHWISASPASTQTLTEKYGIASNAVTTVPAFIQPVARKEAVHNELKDEARHLLGISRKAFVVMGCGTVYWRKGPDLFVETAKRLRSLTSHPLVFVWLGQGPDQEALVAGLTEEEKEFIIFAGNYNNANKLLAAADVFFLASREDPFPLVVLESAQHAVPTVCFAPATGITTFIEQDAGIALSEISAWQAADALHNLLEDSLRRQLLGQIAKQKLFEGYTTDQQNLKIFDVIRRNTGYCPSVSVIVPFYNHERFIDERLNSILCQSIKDIEIIALDDCSTDNSSQKITPYLKDQRIRLIQNEVNSGSPFMQWEKGISEAQGNLVWIAEGDDSCDYNFLSTLLPYFDDSMVHIASARTEIIDENGDEKDHALTPYLDMAYPGKFHQSYINDGFQEVNEQLGAMCTLVNASALVIRKSSFGPALKQAQSWKMCGDWLIYLECLIGGKIAYDVRTRNFFRRHTTSQVHKIEGTPTYFSEREAITKYVVENFPVSKRLLKKAFNAIDHEWERFKYKNPDRNLSELYDKKGLQAKARLRPHQGHVAFYVHGMVFSKGGIERLAGQLANHLVENGWQVTIYCRVHTNSRSVYPLYESVRVVPIFDEHRLEHSIKNLNQVLNHDEVDIFVPMLSEWLFEPIVEAAQNTGVTVIASEHNDPWKIEELWWNRERRIACFEKVDAIHLLLNKYKESLPEYLQHKVTTIPNGVKIPVSLNLENREQLIVSVGRLVPQKRFDRLIDAVGVAQDALRASGHRVEIYGEGPLRNDLETQISNFGLEDLVFLKGNTDQIDAVYERADFFVLPSDFEGLPITLLEALSYGLPVIGFKDCNGLNEIIRSDENGKLVSSVKELAEFMREYIFCPSNVSRKSLMKSAHKYSIEKTLDFWKGTLSGFMGNL